MIRSDFHMHSRFSTDGKSEMRDMIDSAVSKGLENICFTEHMDYDNPYDEGPGAFEVDTDSYFKKYKELSSAEKRINVFFGVELGLQPHIVEHYKQYVKEYPFDFIIGSSHVVKGKDPGSGGYYELFESEEKAHRAYFEEELKCAELFDVYDIYGHLDYALRYGPTADKSFSYRKYSDILDEILKTVINKGKGIEINSAGFRKGMTGPNPAESILKRYRELGGEIITVGSDAHSTVEIAADFDRAINVLINCGFKYYTLFRKRIPEQIPLQD